MTKRRLFLVGTLATCLGAVPAFAQNYGAPVAPLQTRTTAEKDAANRASIAAKKRRIAAQENSRRPSVRLTDAGAGVVSPATNGGLPTAFLTTRSNPVEQDDNRARLVPQR